MKFNKVTQFVAASIGIIITGVILISGINAPTGIGNETGGHGETNCSKCHILNPVNSDQGSISITSTIPAEGYEPGKTYQITLTITQDDLSVFGMDFQALLENNTNAGTLAVTDVVNTKILTVAGLANVVHANTVNTTVVGSKAFTFNWTAPVSSSVGVTFYASGIASNGSGDNLGDYVYTTELNVTPANLTSASERITNIQKIEVFPNPANHTFNIGYYVAVSDHITFELHDAQGKKVTTLLDVNELPGSRQHTFDFANLPGGVYFLKIITKEGVTGKLIIVE